MPAVPGRLDKNLLNKDAWMWMKLVVSNIMPTRYETTLGIDHVLLIYALMAEMSVFLPGIMFATMNGDPVKTKKQLLPFPMFITKWAAANEVPTYPGDEIFKVPKAQQFFPYGQWKTDSEVEQNPAPTAPVPAPAPMMHEHLYRYIFLIQVRYFEYFVNNLQEKWIKEAFGARNGLSEQEREFRSLVVQSSMPRHGTWRLSVHALGQNADIPCLGVEAYA
ncbi:hypothetical protein PIB30_081846 [Stylosanthes scabra]|uniref:Putative plant transposon protein domain-containing protein n=1 Tax=Stylosanthes scabra TaxID=79078 RepID=A0ABU6WT07_9FABA|nr:hypothetical protein [Stylosanthes scabra]